MRLFFAIMLTPDVQAAIYRLRADLAKEREKVKRMSACEAAAEIPAVMEYCKGVEEQLTAAQATIAECHEAITVGDIERKLLAAMRLGSANLDALH